MHELPTHKRESGDDRRLAIAAAARDIIVEKGLEGLRTRDIAARVGINIATLHYHVPSKEALVALVAESIRNDFKAQSRRRSRDNKTALELLRMEFEDFAESITDMPQLIVVMAELSERARRDDEIAAIMSPLGDFWRNQFVQILGKGMTDGSFRSDIDPSAGALMITGALSEYGRLRGRFSTMPTLFAELERAFTRSPSSQG